MNFNLMHPAEQIVLLLNRVYQKGLTTTSGGNLSILDSEGNDVTDHYYLKNSFGLIEVTAKSLVIEAGSATKVYDGRYLECKDYTITGLIEGETEEVVVFGLIKNIGSCDNVIKSVTIIDGNGDDVTMNYKITYIKGLLTVTYK